MALEDIRDNLKEQARAIGARIQESSVWISLNEKYQSLSPTAQKASLLGSAVLVALILMSVPWMFYSGSQASMEEFESKRTLVRDLFRVTREASSIPLPPPPVSATDLQTNARSALSAARLQPEQITAVNESPISVAGIAKTIDQSGIVVSLSKLNLKQVVEIGHELQNLHQMARMSGLEIKANASDPKYYDAVYKIVAFSAKPEAAPRSKGHK